MNELDTLRQEINRIDNELLRLLLEREKVSQGVAEYKASNNLPIYQPQRELELFERIKEKSIEYGLEYEYIKSLYKLIVEKSKSIQLKQGKNIA